MISKLQDKVLSYLSSIDSFWGRVIIIGAILSVGFEAGLYYQETKMMREQFSLEKNEWEKQCKYIDSLRDRIFKLQNENSSLNNQVVELNFKLKHHEKE